MNKQNLALSHAYLDIEAFKKVEVLKNFAFQSLIMSPRLKVAEHRGKDIVKAIFKALEEDEGYLLMPEDFQHLYRGMSDGADKKRVICDFIAGMSLPLNIGCCTPNGDPERVSRFSSLARMRSV